LRLPCFPKATFPLSSFVHIVSVLVRYQSELY
jgi:hypothetical protein